MFDRILVAVGGHDASLEPARVAGRLACLLGSQLTIVSVHRPAPSVLGEPFYSESLIPRLEEADTMLDRARELATAEGAFEPQVESLEGDPAVRIGSLARDGGFGLVVMGTRRRGRVEAALLGSVSAAVAAHSTAPVMIVPEQPSADAR
jgi:nucleotide-binding universal stress UspA family protein